MTTITSSHPATRSRRARSPLTTLMVATVLSLTSLSATAATEMPPFPEVTGDVVEGDGNDYSLKFNISLTQSSAQCRGLE